MKKHLFGSAGVLDGVQYLLGVVLLVAVALTWSACDCDQDINQCKGTYNGQSGTALCCPVGNGYQCSATCCEGATNGCCPETGGPCPSGQAATGSCVGTTCCPTAKVCGSVCCGPNETCNQAKTACCDNATQIPCGSTCCSKPGEVCINQNSCCPSGQQCGTAPNQQCCKAGQSCQGGRCTCSNDQDCLGGLVCCDGKCQGCCDDSNCGGQHCCADKNCHECCTDAHCGGGCMKCDNYKCRVSKGKVVRGVLELVGTPGVIPTQCVTMTVCPGAPMPSPCGSAAPSTPTAPPDYAANQPFIPQMIAAVVAEAKAVERE